MSEQTLTVKVLADISDLKKGMSQVQSELKNTTKQTSGMSSALKGIGKAALAAFSIGAVIDFGKQMVEATADLRALNAQFEQTFGGDIDTAMAKISEQAKQQNIDVDRLKSGWSSFEGMFKGFGISAESSMTLTQASMNLAADAAAYYDKSLEDTSSSLKSFLMGNLEAGDAIGVNYNAKMRDADANSMYGKSWQDLTQEQQAFLMTDVVSKIYEQNGAVGQAAREGNSWENTTANLQATWNRFLAVVGSPVLDGLTIALGYISDAISVMTSYIQGVDWSSVSAGSEPVNKIMALFNQLKETFMKVWEETLQPLLISFGSMLVDLKEPAEEVINAIIDYFSALAEFWKTYIYPVLQGLVEFVINNMDKIKTGIQSALGIITGIFKLFTAILQGDWSGAWEALKSIAINILNGLQNSFSIILEAIKAIFGDKFNAAKDMVLGIIENIKSGISDKFNTIKNNVAETFNAIKDAITNPVDTAKSLIQKAIDAIRGFFDFKWSFPELKMPHFKISGSFSLNPPKVPSLGVDWYSRGGIFTKPTILNGIGVGDASNGGGSAAEVVAPLSDLKQMLGLGENSSNTTINLNGNYSFRDKDDMDYLLNKLALVARRV